LRQAEQCNGIEGNGLHDESNTDDKVLRNKVAELETTGAENRILVLSISFVSLKSGDCAMTTRIIIRRVQGK